MGCMRSALFRREHSAYGADMQVAYAQRMAGESLRRARRRANLEKLLKEIGGATKAETDTGTPRTHFVAMEKGRRGLGDALAAKLERAYGKPPGWFDQPEHTAIWPFSLELQDEVLNLPPEDLARLEDMTWNFLRRTRPDELHYADDTAATPAQEDREERERDKARQLIAAPRDKPTPLRKSK